MDVLIAFEAALKRALDTGSESSDSELMIGAFQISTSPELNQVINAEVAEEKYIPSLLQFQKWFQASDRPLREPNPDDPQFDPRSIRYASTAERKVAKTLRYQIAKQTYDQEILHQQKKQERIRTLVSNYRADGGGYLQYVMDTVPQRFPDFPPNFFFESRSLKISEAARRRHTFITGGTGSGKSETIKHLVRHYLTANTDTAVAVLDPHGKLVKEISRFDEFMTSDRLVLIDPNLSEGHRVTINPFETVDRSEAGLETQCAHLIAAFEQILGGFTMNMLSLLPPVITTLLHRDDSDLSDLVRFLDDKQNAELLVYGRSQLPYEEHRQFFQHQFHSPNYESTKDALRNRFQAFINVPTIKRFTCGKNTVNLEQMIDQKKVILFDLSVSGAAKTTTTILGQFITALIQGYSMRRERYKNNPHTPIHLFADECQYFTSSTTEEILGESRKYGLHLTLATQRTEQVGEKIMDAILGNVGVFLVGRNLGKTLKKMSSELEIDKDEIRNLGTGEFFLSTLNRIPIKAKIPYVGHKQRMDKDQWQLLSTTQLERYYRLRDNTDAQPRIHTGLTQGPKFPLPTAPKMPKPDKEQNES